MGLGREGKQACLRSKQNAMEGRTGDKIGDTGSWGACPLHWLVTNQVPGTSALCAGKQNGSSSLRTVPQHTAAMVLAAGYTAHGDNCLQEYGKGMWAADGGLCCIGCRYR